MICPKLKKLLECNCDDCRHQLAIERAGGGEKMYQQSVKQLTDQRLRNTLDHVWQTARQNRLEREEYEKTIRLLSLFDKR